MVIPLYCGCTFNTPSASTSFFVAPNLIGPNETFGTRSIVAPAAVVEVLAVGTAADVVAATVVEVVELGVVVVLEALVVLVDVGAGGGLSHATRIERHARERRCVVVTRNGVSHDVDHSFSQYTRSLVRPVRGSLRRTQPVDS